jgi:hypothetical protein
MGTLMGVCFLGELVISFHLFFFLRAVTASSTGEMKGGVSVYIYAL